MNDLCHIERRGHRWKLPTSPRTNGSRLSLGETRDSVIVRWKTGVKRQGSYFEYANEYLEREFAPRFSADKVSCTLGAAFPPSLLLIFDPPSFLDIPSSRNSAIKELLLFKHFYGVGCVKGVVQAPTDNVVAVNIDYSIQIHKAVLHGNVRYICTPNLIASCYPHSN